MNFNSHVCDVFNTEASKLETVFYTAGRLVPYLNKDTFEVNSHIRDVNIINDIRRRICKKLSLNIQDKQCGFTFKCKKISKDINFIEEYAMTLSKDDNYFIEFAKGLLEANTLPLPNGKILIDRDIDLCKSVIYKMNQECTISDSFITIDHCLDFLNLLYKKTNESKLCNWFLNLKKSMYTCVDVPATEISEKKYLTDAGNDVIATSINCKFSENVYLLDTNLTVAIPNGYWGMLAPRSSIAKHGFMMTNSFGVIDSSYRGNIKIAVTKIDPQAELVLPFKCAQLILIPQVLANYVNYFSTNTMRGSGGYGSTSNL